MKNKTRRKVIISTLIFSLLISMSQGVITAYASSSSKPSPKEEVIYVMTDANGKVKTLDAVNIFNGGKITDYGNYSKVKMLTSEKSIKKSGKKIKIDAGDERIYYQGTMKTREIPWNITIRYFLDGKEYEPGELAGKSGKLKIHFSVTENRQCEGDFYENYALQTAFTLDTQKCENIKAADATIANVGENKQLSYILLPGKGIDTYITADVKNFEMDPVTINGLKLNLNIEVDYTDIDEKADDAKDAMKEIDDGTGEVKDGTEKLDDAAEELKEKIAELYDGTGKLYDGSIELSDGLKEITDKNIELTDGAYKAFEGICTASETILNQQLEENGMSKIKLTPYNYTSVLEDILEDLDGAKIYRTAYDKAYYEVSKKVTAQEETLYYQGALQTVKAQLLKSGMTEEQADAYLQSEEGQALVAGAAAGMNDEQKKQIKEAYIQQTMQSSEVTSQINAAVRKAEEASDQVEELKTRLDDYNTFYEGVCDYTDAVTEAEDGAAELSENMQTLDENTGLLNDAIIEFRDKIGELLDGISELKDGTEEFLEEISKLKKEIHDKVSEMIDELKGKGILRSFVSEKNTEIKSVQFVIKTDGISVDDEPAAEQATQETLSFWQKLLNLFGLS